MRRLAIALSLVCAAATLLPAQAKQRTTDAAADADKVYYGATHCALIPIAEYAPAPIVPIASTEQDNGTPVAKSHNASSESVAVSYTTSQSAHQ